MKLDRIEFFSRIVEYKSNGYAIEKLPIRILLWLANEILLNFLRIDGVTDCSEFF